MTGKLCLDFEQPAVINESFAPSPSDVAWAIDFFAEFEAAGSVIRDGSDKPRLARAAGDPLARGAVRDQPVLSRPGVGHVINPAWRSPGVARLCGGPRSA